ncbi:hypothetical protein SD70_06005 [Gordoniibacillus kamchatkensis]|uniref:Hemerythrin-like domain-containing protein n=1 Tax=Gordoniibacillus kamchatkensis TaxID=1590651 RepID=A0ABR5AKV4_9BACL|nr:hemerythrin domain-containing protein [Paenibacillus sp. VKM B-2647]KIL41666.1 hypothetical protein SD70_06005 [Paenibacillus sp. VKM B-2647]
MVHAKESQALDPSNVACPSPWMLVSMRLKDEHDQLTEELQDIRFVAQSIYDETDTKRARAILQALKRRMVDFMRRLHAHSEWEEREVFPVVNLYFHRLLKPSITPSIWVMEKEQKLADLFAQSFFEAEEALPEAATREQNRQAAAHLLQACLILQEHFELEEELIFPLAEQMLTDIDYFHS